MGTYLFELGSESLVLLRQLGDDGRLLPLGHFDVVLLLVQGPSQIGDVALQLRYLGLVFTFNVVHFPPQNVLFLLQNLVAQTNNRRKRDDYFFFFQRRNLFLFLFFISWF